MASLTSMNLLRLRGFPILQQLHLEERLLRTSSDNWCIINDGTTAPTIVMGISGYATVYFYASVWCILRIFMFTYRYYYCTMMNNVCDVHLCNKSETTLGFSRHEQT